MDDQNRKMKKRVSSKNKQSDRRQSDRSTTHKHTSQGNNKRYSQGHPKKKERNSMGTLTTQIESDSLPPFKCELPINIGDIDIDYQESHSSHQSPSRVMDQEEEEALEKLRLERMMCGQRRGAFYAANTSYVNRITDEEEIPEAPSSNSGLIMLNKLKLNGNIEYNVKSKSRRIHCGFAETIGRRKIMEDNFIFIGSVKGKRKQDFFGVFDGHRGVTASKFVVDEIENVLYKSMRKYKEHKKMLRATFACINKMMKKQHVSSGTTAVAGFRYRDKCYIVNIGDSRAVLSENGSALRVTQDHKPDRLDELDRITRLGGEVTNYVAKDGEYLHIKFNCSVLICYLR